MIKSASSPRLDWSDQLEEGLATTPPCANDLASRSLSSLSDCHDCDLKNNFFYYYLHASPDLKTARSLSLPFLRRRWTSRPLDLSIPRIGLSVILG